MASQKRDPRKDPKVVLGEALKQLRLDAGHTQAAAAAQVTGWGEDSLQKAESGRQVPVDDFYAALLELYQVTPREKAILDVLREHARAADPVIPEFAELWLETEPEAAIIHAWSLDSLPGQLQTYDYAFAMFIKGGQNEDQAAARATARVNRAAILDRSEPTRLTALVYEPLLHRLVGSPETMAGELEHLLEMMDKANVTIQIIRETEYYFPGHDGQFQIASGRKIPDTLNEISLQDHTTTTPAAVDRAIIMFDEIRGYALSVAESRAVIQEALQRWKNRKQ